MDKLSRRQALRNVVLGGFTVAATSLVAACGGAAPSPSAAGTSSGASAAAPTAAPAANAQQPAATAPVPASQAGATQVVPASQVGATAGATPAEAAVPGPGVVAMPPKSATPVTLRFHMRSGGEKSEPAIYVYRPQEWEQGTGNKVKLEPIPGGNDYIPKLEALAASNTIGDLTWTSDVYSEHSHLVKFKVLDQVDSYLKTYKISKDEWFSAITDTLTYDGVMYGLPKTGHPA
ncbi:MAG: extracellular solute-binding protein, partial [Chloroflexota bacterium]